MFRNYLFTVLMLLPFALSAQDSRYQLISSNAQTDIHVDRQSISRSGNIVQAWVRYHMKRQSPDYYSNILNKVDCQKHEVAVLTIVLLDASNDQVLRTEAGSGRSERVTPGSVGGNLKDFLCKDASS